MAHSPLFDRITVIGLGLIGGSIARALRERHLAGIIIGCDPNEVSLAYGRKHGFIDKATQDPEQAVAESSLVIIATPPSKLGEMVRVIAPHLKPGALIMDVCSVKQAAIAAIAPHIPEYAEYIPAHPIAGSEQSGIGAARSDLFQRRRVIVTPETLGEDNVLQKATAFWQGLGARVEGMPPHLHDLIYAYVSHLPHLLAFAARQIIGNHGQENDILKPFLRLSDSNVSLWAEIFLLNKENMLKALDRYLDAIAHIEKELRQAPAGNPSKEDQNQARYALFPRIAASCMVTTVMEAEKQAGFPFARYAGEGFADFTSPAGRPPEEDIERISNQYHEVAALLEVYRDKLRKIRAALDTAPAKLEKALTGRR